MAMTQEEAERTITQNERDRYIEWIREAIREYVDGYSAPQKLVHSKGARAHVINSHIIDRIIRGFTEIRGARFRTVRGRNLLQVADTHVSWFKKLTDRKRPSYIRTRQAIRYVGQLEISGANEPTHLILGYQLNALATDCSAIYIICPDGDQNAWAWKIWNAEPDTMTMFPVIESPSPSTGPTRIRPRVVAKVADRKPNV